MLPGSEAYSINVGGSPCIGTVFALDAASLTENTGWLNVALLGEWKGHHQGPFAFTREAFDKIIANFNARKTPVKVDYEHDSLSGEPGPKPAAGFVKELELRANGTELWARVDWTARAAKYIRDGEYTRCSPVVDFAAKDRVSGKPIGPELIQVGLTDDPFLDGLHATYLKRFSMSDSASDNTGTVQLTADEEAAKAAEEAKAKAMSDDAASVSSESADAVALLDVIAEAIGSDRSSVLKALADKVDEIVEVARKTLKQDGTAMSAAAASKDADAKRLDAIALKRQQDENVALKARVDQLEKKAAQDDEAKVVAHVEKLVEDGYCKPDDQSKADAVFAFKTNADWAKRNYATKVVPVGESQSGADPSVRQMTAIDLDKLDEAKLTTEEQDLVRMMSAARINKKTIALKLNELRAGKVN